MTARGAFVLVNFGPLVRGSGVAEQLQRVGDSALVARAARWIFCGATSVRYLARFASRTRALRPRICTTQSRKPSGSELGGEVTSGADARQVGNSTAGGRYSATTCRARLCALRASWRLGSPNRAADTTGHAGEGRIIPA